MYNLIDRYLTVPSTILDIGANFGTFAFIPTQKGHKVLAVESDIDTLACLEKTYLGIPNISITNSVPEVKEKIDCIHFARKSTLLHDITQCSNILVNSEPVVLLHINTIELKKTNQTPSDVIRLLESLGFHSFLYNAPNFLLAVDKNQIFPFCEMVLIAMHRNSIINSIGTITYGEYLPRDMLDNLLNTNLANATDDCLEYLNSLNKV